MKNPNTRIDANGVEHGDTPIHKWFGLTYAQFLTIPRIVLSSMPYEWQAKMVAFLEEMDDTFEWRPLQGSYYVRLRTDDGKFHKPDPQMCDYRHGDIEHLRKPTPE